MVFKHLGFNVLLIDDAEIDMAIFEMTLKLMLIDAHLEFCTNGKTAIDKLVDIHLHDPENTPDYIFLDLNMPIMNGMKFLDEFERLDIDPEGNTKIYILSSSISDRDINRSTQNPHVANFLHKPINFEKVKEIFAQA